MVDSTISGSGHHGFAAPSARVERSNITGNVLDTEECGLPQRCADLATARPPRVLDVTCGTSRRLGETTSWDVCAND
jgi:hypothetical protein